MTTTTQKQIEDWIDHERWKDTERVGGDLLGGGALATALLSIIWAFVGSVGQLSLWDFVLGWDQTKKDEVPPFFTETLFIGWGLIFVVCFGFLLSVHISYHKAQLPHELSSSQFNAARRYGRLSDDDKKRCRLALIDYLMWDQYTDTYDEGVARSERWASLDGKIEEKNQLQRRVSTSINHELEIETETNILDQEIAQLKSEIAGTPELN